MALNRIGDKPMPADSLIIVRDLGEGKNRSSDSTPDDKYADLIATIMEAAARQLAVDIDDLAGDVISELEDRRKHGHSESDP